MYTIHYHCQSGQSITLFDLKPTLQKTLLDLLGHLVLDPYRRVRPRCFKKVQGPQQLVIVESHDMIGDVFDLRLAV